MSGGHWNYDQRYLATFGATLEEEKEPMLRTVGKMLVGLSEGLDILDRVYSADCGPERRAEALEIINAAMFKAAAESFVIASIDQMVENALKGNFQGGELRPVTPPYAPKPPHPPETVRRVSGN